MLLAQICDARLRGDVSRGVYEVLTMIVLRAPSLNSDGLHFRSRKSAREMGRGQWSEALVDRAYQAAERIGLWTTTAGPQTVTIAGERRTVRKVYRVPAAASAAAASAAAAPVAEAPALRVVPGGAAERKADDLPLLGSRRVVQAVPVAPPAATVSKVPAITGCESGGCGKCQRCTVGYLLKIGALLEVPAAIADRVVADREVAS